MKAIIISDDSKTIAVLDKVLVEHNFDTIIYRWLLKALDNIEEIRPDLVIVSVSEYPRHWKTLTQFVASGIGGERTKIMLMCQNPLSEDERKKAAALGVKGFFNGIDEDGISQLVSFLNFNFDTAPLSQNQKAQELQEDELETEIESEVEEKEEIIFDVSDAVLLFTNPKSGKIITGKVSSYKNKVVEFTPDSFELVANLKEDNLIDLLTFELDSNVRNYKAKIISISENMMIELTEEIDG